MAHTPEQVKAYKALRAGRKPFRGYPPERAAGKLARRNMLNVFALRMGFSTPVEKICMELVPQLRELIKSGNHWEWKNGRFSKMLDRYAKAATDA